MPDERYVGNAGFDDWWYDDWDWTSWDDDWSWDQTWNSPWNEPTSSSPPSLQDSQNKTSVTVTELPSSSTSGSGAKVSAVASGPPPGIDRTSNSRKTGSTSRSKPLSLAAVTIGTFGVGNSVLVGPIVTSTSKSCFSLDSTSQSPRNEGDRFDTLQTVGLNHVKLPDSEDRFIDQHLTVAPTVDTVSILFAAAEQPTAVPRVQELSPRMATFANHWNKTPHFAA